MKRAKWALLLALAATIGSPTLVMAQESVEAPAERVAAFAEATYTLRPRLTSEGSLVGDIGTLVSSGTVRTIPNLPVSLVSEGKIVARVMTNTEGEFAFPQVAPGAYTLVASNARILHVAPAVVGPYVEGESSVLHLIAASPLSAERRKAMMVGMGRGPKAAAFQATPVFEPMVTTYRALISAEGAVSGRVSASGVDMTGLVIRVFREGEPIGEAEVNADGAYSLTGLTPGPVSIVAFGPQGMAAFAVELVASQPVAALLTSDAEALVSFLQDASGSLDFELSSSSDVQAGASVPGDSFSTPDGDALAGEGTMDGSTAAGSGSFSTGGGGGGGAGGGIGALGALGAAAAAVAGSNGGGGFVPTPSTTGGGT